MKNKELLKLLKSVQEDEIEEVKIKEKTVSGEDVTIEYVLENVKNYKEFCDVTGLRYWHESEFVDCINPKKICAQEKLNQIESFFYKDDELDWENRKQSKYYIYFKFEEGSKKLRGGSRSSLSTEFYAFNIALPTATIADFVKTTFIDIYQDLL